MSHIEYRVYDYTFHQFTCITCDTRAEANKWCDHLTELHPYREFAPVKFVDGVQIAKI